MAFGLEKGQCAEANLRASRTMVPKALEPYVMGKFVRTFPGYMYLHLGVMHVFEVLESLNFVVVFFKEKE